MRNDERGWREEEDVETNEMLVLTVTVQTAESACSLIYQTPQMHHIPSNISSNSGSSATRIAPLFSVLMSHVPLGMCWKSLFDM